MLLPDLRIRFLEAEQTFVKKPLPFLRKFTVLRRFILMGPDTRQAQREIVLAYLNSMPLAARPHWGEVHGLGDGLSAWYGADFGKVNQLLSAEANNSGKPISRDKAVAYRQVLNLLLGQRRPTHYLGSDYESLQTLTDKYLRILATYGIGWSRSPPPRSPVRLGHRYS